MLFCVGMFRLLPVFMSQPFSRSHANRRVPPMSIPLPLSIFASSPTRMSVLLALTASANSTLGACASSCLCCSSTLDLSQFIAAKVICSGVIDSCPAM